MKRIVLVVLLLASMALAQTAVTGSHSTTQFNSTSPTTSNGSQQPLQSDGRGNLLVTQDHLNRIHCVVTVSTATTVQAVGNSCVAPGAGLSLYVDTIEFGSSAAGGTAADSFPTIKSGTGGTCGTATAVVWQAMTAANTTTVSNRSTPIKVAANSELCWIMSTAGSKTIQISGWIAP